jgi:hypothetical protein
MPGRIPRLQASGQAAQRTQDRFLVPRSKQLLRLSPTGIPISKMGQKLPLFIQKMFPTDDPNISPICSVPFSVIQKWSLSLPIWSTVPRLLPPAAALLYLFHGCTAPLLLSTRRRAASSVLGKNGDGGARPKGGGKSGLGHVGEEWWRRSSIGHTHRSTPQRQRGSGAWGRQPEAARSTGGAVMLLAALTFLLLQPRPATLSPPRRWGRRAAGAHRAHGAHRPDLVAVRGGNWKRIG